MPAQLILSSEAVVLVEYGLFYLYDDAYLQEETPPLPAPVSAGTGWIALSAGATDERVQVQLEAWSESPDAPTNAELQTEVAFTAPSGHVRLWSVTMGPSAPEAEAVVLGPPGLYTARISSWGRQQAADIYAADPTSLLTGDRIVERYVLQFWRAALHLRSH